MNITALVLAAGASFRMGRSKQLLPIDNEPLLARTIRTVEASRVNTVFVVLGCQHEVHREAIESLPVRILIHHEWHKGMGSSLKAGVNHILQYNSPDAILVLVCDQPLLATDHLNSMIERYEDNRSKLVASTYKHIVGVPALFDRFYFSVLQNIADARGAKEIIEEHGQLSDLVEFTGGEVDLDHPHDYEDFIKRS